MEQLETEIKFYFDDLSPIRQRLIGLGAHSRGRSFESNIRSFLLISVTPLKAVTGLPVLSGRPYKVAAQLG